MAAAMIHQPLHDDLAPLAIDRRDGAAGTADGGRYTMIDHRAASRGLR